MATNNLIPFEPKSSGTESEEKTEEKVAEESSSLITQFLRELLQNEQKVTNEAEALKKKYKGSASQKKLYGVSDDDIRKYQELLRKPRIELFFRNPAVAIKMLGLLGSLCDQDQFQTTGERVDIYKLLDFDGTNNLQPFIFRPTSDYGDAWVDFLLTLKSKIKDSGKPVLKLIDYNNSPAT